MAEHGPPSGLDLGRTTPLVPHVYQTWAEAVPDLDTSDRIINGEESGFFNARDSHPNARHLADQIAQWEGASWAVICGSGMAAISATILSLTQQGDRIVAGASLYGRTTILLRQELTRYGLLPTCFQRAHPLAA